MPTSLSPVRRLAILLWLVALHSFCVGILMILRPAPLMEMAGFAMNAEPFFTVQNGVFHIVLAIGYILAAAPEFRHRSLVVFTIVIKSMAAIFLFTYYFGFDARSVILLSGIGDGAMALAVFLCFRAAERGR